MKIVHVIASIDPKFGGLQAVAMRIAAAQALLGCEVHVVTYGSPAVQSQVMELGQDIPGFDKIRWHILPEANRLEALFSFKGRRVLRELIRDESFIHIHGIWEPFLLHASKLARATDTPYCVCPAGMLDRWSLRQRPWKKRFALRLCYRSMLEHAKFLHVLNADEAAAIAELNLSVKGSVIPNGVFTEEFQSLPEKGRFYERMPALDGRRYVLFLSRLHIKKGLDILAEAFARLADRFKDVDLVIAGPAGGAERDFMAQVDKLGLTSRVHMTGPLYGRTKLEAIVDAACFCLPSRQEGFSMAITEALACGIPVVITRECHFPEVASAGAGYVVGLEPAEVAAAMARVLENEPRASEMGRNGRQLVFETFTWPAIADRALRSYRLSA